MKINIPSNVETILYTLEANGYEAYIVGGCVRDSLLGRKPKDYDVCTNALPDDIIRVFNNHKVIPTGLKHGTVTVVIDGENIEVTTYRVDGKYEDSRRPKSVEFTSSLTEDLSRRDFTMNAIAYNPKTGLVDPFNGQRDIENKVIKTVGNANERFEEDALRMLRAIRFSSQLQMSIESDTVILGILENHDKIKYVSKERIHDELNKILITSKPSDAFIYLLGTGMLFHIIPELVESVGFEQHNPNHDLHVFNHTLLVLDHVEPVLKTRLAALFHDIAKPRTFTKDEKGIGHFYGHHLTGMDMTIEILKRLRYDNQTVEDVSILVKEHMTRGINITPRSVKRFINRVGVNNLDSLFDLMIADSMSCLNNDVSDVLLLKKEVEVVLNEKQALTVKDLAINGNDLIALGMKPSKQMGEILNNLLVMVIDDNSNNNSEFLLKKVKQLIADKEGVKTC